MLVKLCLFTCVLAVGQQGNRNLWQLSPRLERGQELVYSGSFVEESLAASVEFQRRNRLETRFVILDVGAKGWDVAVLTTLQKHGGLAGAAKGGKQFSSSVRLEKIRVDKNGRVTTPGGHGLALSLDGPPTLEFGAFVAVPAKRVRTGHEWTVTEPGQPTMTWRVVGTEIINSTRCVKLEGKQQSPDWRSPRADSVAWKRVDHVWLAPQTGVVYRVQRVIEQRQPARTRPTRRFRISYDLDRNWIYPRRLFQNYRQELLQVARFHAEADRLVRRPNFYRNELERKRQQIRNYLERQEGSLQRQALVQIKERIEAAQRGELAVPPETPAVPLIPEVKLGKRAPDFLVTDLMTRRSVRLYHHVGRPVLIIFYNPKTPTGHRVLRFAREISAKHRTQLTILGMAVSDDVAYIRKQYREMKLSFPVLDGKGLHRTFGVDGTPRIVLLDSQGMVRFCGTGWGIPVAEEIRTKLRRCLPNQKRP